MAVLRVIIAKLEVELSRLEIHQSSLSQEIKLFAQLISKVIRDAK